MVIFHSYVKLPEGNGTFPLLREFLSGFFWFYFVGSANPSLSNTTWYPTIKL